MRRANHLQPVSVPLVLFLLLATINLNHVMSQNTTPPTTKPVLVDVGVVLNMQTRNGKMSMSCISMALSDLYSSHPYYKTRLLLHTRDSNESVVGAAAAALDLIKNVQVQAIIGPATSMQTNFVINLGDKAQVPIISFSATSPSLTSLRSPYFFRATLNDSYQVKPIASIIKAFGWRQAVPIYVDNEFGEGILPYLIDALQDAGAKVPYRCAINPLATDDEIVLELYKLMTMQTRVFILHMLPSLGSRVFTKAEEIGMMKEGYVWIMSDGMTNLLNLMDPLVVESMEGVLGVRGHVPRRKRLEDFIARWREKSRKENITDVDINIFGLWAYDAATALARAIEKVGNKDFSYQNMSNVTNSLDLQSFGVSKTGVDQCENLETIKFRGLAGEFDIINGELQPPAFQILNVVDSGERTIGFWTPEHGILRRLLGMQNLKYSTSKANLKSIEWPGDATAVPRGWVIPSNEKKLKIGVPVKDGFTQFVKVNYEDDAKTARVTGFCIDVFDAVMESLPYNVPYDFVPFANGTYNDLVYQVRLGVFDAVVGDVTIVANRSLNVDFTLPFSESSVVVVVPFKDSKHENAWIFLKPLTWDLWVTSASFFLIIAFVIWVLEHRINEDFMGSREDQTVTSIWFSFSTMVFQHKEKVVSSLAKFVVIIWCFVVLILTQSYTASLTSMLTVQQLEPTITDVNDLLRHGENVGYQKGSFVSEIVKQLKFDESKIKIYGSMEELEALLSKGTAKGGIAAAFEELPYARVFLAKHCSKYTVAEPTFKADGFGFVFPMGSPLVPDVSRAILKVTEGEQMGGIEKKWLGQPKSCPKPGTSGSESLRLGSFWGLFLVVGVAASFALIIFGAKVFYENRHYLMGIPRSRPVPPGSPRLLDQDPYCDHYPNIEQNQDVNEQRRGEIEPEMEQTQSNLPGTSGRGHEIELVQS